MKKMQLSNNSVIVTFIVNILFNVSVCIDIPLIRQDNHKNKFSNVNTIIYFPIKLKSYFKSAYTHTCLMLQRRRILFNASCFVDNLSNRYCLESKKAIQNIKVSLLPRK